MKHAWTQLSLGQEACANWTRFEREDRLREGDGESLLAYLKVQHASRPEKDRKYCHNAVWDGFVAHIQAQDQTEFQQKQLTENEYAQRDRDWMKESLHDAQKDRVKAAEKAEEDRAKAEEDRAEDKEDRAKAKELLERVAKTQEQMAKSHEQTANIQEHILLNTKPKPKVAKVLTPDQLAAKVRIWA